MYTAIGVGISAALFYGIHAFARPPPRTMTKEWQEATNEYLKVSFQPMKIGEQVLTVYRKKESTLFMVSAARTTVERVSCKANRRSLKASRSKKKNRCVDYRDGCTSHTKFLQLGVLFQDLGWCMSCATAPLTTHVQNLNPYGFKLDYVYCRGISRIVALSDLFRAFLRICERTILRNTVKHLQEFLVPRFRTRSYRRNTG